MKTWQFNGEYWYVNNRSLFRRIRQWFIWIGMWEKSNGQGWDWDRVFKLKSPTPISLFGNLFTYYGWGFNVSIKGTYFVCSFVNKQIYCSPDGTPSKATIFFRSPPREVLEQIEKRNNGTVHSI